MKAKHTSGPWHWVNGETDKPVDYLELAENVIPEAQETHFIGSFSLRTMKEYETRHVGPLPKFICDAEGEMTKADMRLIAASPDLLHALEMIRDADNDCKKDGLQTIPPAARLTIDRAISKATGEP